MYEKLFERTGVPIYHYSDRSITTVIEIDIVRRRKKAKKEKHKQKKYWLYTQTLSSCILTVKKKKRSFGGEAVTLDVFPFCERRRKKKREEKTGEKGNNIPTTSKYLLIFNLNPINGTGDREEIESS